VDNNYSPAVLRKVLTVYLTHPEQLTEHEQHIAERVCSCSLCDGIWIRRKRKSPQRCPKCHKHAWNRPLLESIAAIDRAKTDAAAKKAPGA
jgi:hypothetical protein